MKLKYAIKLVWALLLMASACKQEASKTMTEQKSNIPACLQETIESHKANYPTPFATPANITHYRYNSQDVYIYDPDPSHSKLRDWMYKAVDANCQEVCNFGGGFANRPSTCPYFDEKAEKVGVIWTHQ